MPICLNTFSKFLLNWWELTKLVSFIKIEIKKSIG